MSESFDIICGWGGCAFPDMAFLELQALANHGFTTVHFDITDTELDRDLESWADVAKMAHDRLHLKVFWNPVSYGGVFGKDNEVNWFLSSVAGVKCRGVSETHRTLEFACTNAPAHREYVTRHVDVIGNIVGVSGLWLETPHILECHCQYCVGQPFENGTDSVLRKAMDKNGTPKEIKAAALQLGSESIVHHIQRMAHVLNMDEGFARDIYVTVDESCHKTEEAAATLLARPLAQVIENMSRLAGIIGSAVGVTHIGVPLKMEAPAFDKTSAGSVYDPEPVVRHAFQCAKKVIDSVQERRRQLQIGGIQYFLMVEIVQCDEEDAHSLGKTFKKILKREGGASVSGLHFQYSVISYAEADDRKKAQIDTKLCLAFLKGFNGEAFSSSMPMQQQQQIQQA